VTVVVVTDSSARLPAPIRDHYDIRQVPLHVLTPDANLAEGVDEIGPDVLDQPGTTTSGATPADLSAVFESAVADSDGDGVVAVSMSRKLSGTWSSARLAAESFPGRVRVVDTRSVGLAVGFAAIAAAQAARAGGEMDRVYEAAIRAASTSETLVCVADLGRLRASGRIGAAARLFGTALSIKPVLRVVDGSLVLAERQRTFSKALTSMVSTAVASADRQPTTVGIVHADAADVAADVLERLREKLRVVTSAVVTDLGPVLTAHTGTGAVGVVVCPGLDPIEGYTAP
jgi:DegV family protein with EDD domain